MKISDFKGEEAVDLLADLLDPVTELVKDDKFKKLFDGAIKMDIVKHCLKEHKSSIIEILALLDRRDPREYEPSIIEITSSLLELLDDKELMKLFQSQSQREIGNASGSVTETTEVKKN